MVQQKAEELQSVAEDVGFTKLQLWRSLEHIQAFPPQPWEHLLPWASSEDTRPSTNTRFILFVQTVPVITSWTDVERKAFTFPKDLQQPFFLLISFVLAKKASEDPICPMENKKPTPNCQS